jgi:hypothetical protein
MANVVHVWRVVVASTVNCNTESEVYHDFTYIRLMLGQHDFLQNLINNCHSQGTSFDSHISRRN